MVFESPLHDGAIAILIGFVQWAYRVPRNTFRPHCSPNPWTDFDVRWLILTGISFRISWNFKFSKYIQNWKSYGTDILMGAIGSGWNGERGSPRFSIKLWQAASGWQNNLKLMNFDFFAGVVGSPSPSGQKRMRKPLAISPAPYRSHQNVCAVTFPILDGFLKFKISGDPQWNSR